MKAIQIKYLSATNNRGSRYKAWTDAGAIIEGYDYALSGDKQARRLAERYNRETFGDTDGITGFGTLPNGDFVATIGR